METNATYGMTEIKLISPSPLNPRKSFPGPKLDELIASIKLKGVIQPIVIRPVEGKEAPYEIVVGERRYKASIEAGCTGIPAIVREMTDDEAYDFMLIENLHREDLTEREEADSFKAYTDRHGDDGIIALAEKTGIKPGYIRSRIRVLDLPAPVLKAWDKGDLAFGHLQQLLRVSDEKALEEVFGWLMEGGDAWNDEGGIPTVKSLADHIAEEAPPLSGAFFKTKEFCSKCTSNALVQRALFDVEAKKAHCLNPGCFVQHQREWLIEHWKETDIAKKAGTNGFRFAGEIDYNQYESFYGGARKKCRECPDFVSIIEITGRVEHDKVCIGDKACYKAITDPKTAREKKTGERDPEAPRASWHGEYFRDVFLSKRIAEVLPTIDPCGQVARALLLVCAMHPGYRSFLEARGDCSGVILKKTPAEVDAAILKTIEKIVLDGQHRGESNYNGFGTKGRQLVARYLGIDLAKEFAVDKDYLEKKTKAEIVAFGKKFKLLDPAQVSKLKKTELIKQVLAHGDKLVGKVPVEILKGTTGSR